jgi:ribosomal protein S19E (S16A)
LAEKLKEYPEIKPPEGSQFWKTGFFKEKIEKDQGVITALKEAEKLSGLRCSS